MNSNEKYFTVEEIIRLCREQDINLGRGDPYNTLRYYTKIGLLPHMVRRKFSPAAESAVGHYPEWVLERLKRIDGLKLQGFNNDQIAEVLADEAQANRAAAHVDGVAEPEHNPHHPLHTVEQASAALPHFPHQSLWVNLIIQTLAFLLILALVLITLFLITLGFSPIGRARLQSDLANFGQNFKAAIFAPNEVREALAKTIIEISDIFDYANESRTDVIAKRDILNQNGFGFLGADDLIPGANIIITPSEDKKAVTISSTGEGEGGGGGGTATEAGNADTLDNLDSIQFLRSDTSDAFTSGTLTFEAGTTLSVAGTLSATGSTALGTTSITDLSVTNTLTVSGASTLGTTTLTGDLNLSSDAGEGVTGAGLVACNLETQTLGYDAVTHKFVCLTDAGAGGGASNLQEAYVGGNTIDITAAEGALDIQAVSANVDFLIGSATDTGDFRIYDGTNNWFFLDESASAITLGNAGATVALTSAGNWSISATGVASGLSGTNTGFTAGDLSCTNCIGPLEISDLTLGTDTAGDYLAGITGGDGIIVTGSGGETATPDVDVDLLAVADGAGATASFSGLEFAGASSDKLALLQGCADTQILKYTDAGGWACAADVSGGGGGTLQTTYETGNTVDVTAVEGALDIQGVSANIDFLIGSGTDTGDFRIWDGTNNWFFIDESAATISIGSAATSFTISPATTFSSTITVGGDAINDFTGTGLVLSGTSVTTTLGTSISNSEIDIDTIDFDRIAFTLTLDEATTISAAAALNLNIGNNVTLQVSGTGAILASDLVCTNCIGPTEISDLTLGTDTTGDYVASFTAGTGLTGNAVGEGSTPTIDVVGGDGLTASADSLDIDLDTTAADGATASSVSGLEFDTGELTLLRGCAAGGILEWNNTTFEWACGVDDTGGGTGTLQTTYETGNTIDVTAAEGALDIQGSPPISIFLLAPPPIPETLGSGME